MANGVYTAETQRSGDEIAGYNMRILNIAKALTMFTIGIIGFPYVYKHTAVANMQDPYLQVVHQRIEEAKLASKSGQTAKTHIASNP